jgi:membrane carboxypeptidase/penicillin-binding protein
MWTDFMKVAHEGLEIPEDGFPEPPGLEHVSVTTRTGMLAAGFCGMAAYTEIMVPGTEPEHYCNAPREDSGVPLLEGPLNGERSPGRSGEDQAPQVDDDFLF